MSIHSPAGKIISGIMTFGIMMMFLCFPQRISAEGASAALTEISDAAGLSGIANDPGGHYKLICDIDLSGADWQPVAFSGKLDGGGHTVYNMRVTGVGHHTRISRDGNRKEYDTSFAGLFSVLENAEVTNLNIKGALVDITENKHCFAALLAGYSDNSTISGCFAEGRVHLVNGGVNAGVGGLVGYGTGIAVDACEADVELVFEDRYEEGRCEQFMGGILSCGIGSLTDCKVRIDGYDSCHGYVHNGGIVGMFYRCGTEYYNGGMTGNYVEGQISFFEDNPDRRAYCKPFAGELLTRSVKVRHNTHQFRSNETRDFSVVLSPEKCGQPDYEDIITPPACESWGYTTHRCRGCGYSWADTYTPPRHEPGEWVIVSDSDEARQGLKRQYCTKCGVLLDEQAIEVKEKQPSAEKNSGSLLLPVSVAAAAALVLPAAIAMLLIARRKKAAKHHP